MSIICLKSWNLLSNVLKQIAEDSDEWLYSIKEGAAILKNLGEIEIRVFRSGETTEVEVEEDEEAVLGDWENPFHEKSAKGEIKSNATRSDFNTRKEVNTDLFTQSSKSRSCVAGQMVRVRAPRWIR